MSELNEIIAAPEPHKADQSDKCPFCPIKEDDTIYHTYSGQNNNSTILADVMGDPSTLVEKQSRDKKEPRGNPRPKDGSRYGSRPRDQQHHIDEIEGEINWQAHHAISGKQAMRGSQVEKWIRQEKGSEIDKDTGYSINNADNGIWMPSIPQNYYSKEFRKVPEEERPETGYEFEYACRVMAAKSRQFHFSHHHIEDSEDPGGKIHPSYDEYIKKKLTAISERMYAWKDVCPLTKEDGKEKTPAQPNYRINDVLDNLSGHMMNKISGSRQSWDIFISEHALNFHKKDNGCSHNRPCE